MFCACRCIRSCAEEALRMLNGTQLGGQSMRLSWGRSTSNKQVGQIFWWPLLLFFIILYTLEFYPCLWLVFYCSPKVIQTSGMVDIMGMLKDMIIAMLQLLLPKTPTCTMEDILGMEIINSLSSSNKWDIAKVLLFLWMLLSLLVWWTYATWSLVSLSGE